MSNQKRLQTRRWDQMIKQYRQTLLLRLKQLNKILKYWSSNQSRGFKLIDNYKHHLIKYSLYSEEKSNTDRLHNNIKFKRIQDQHDLKQVQTQKEIYLGYELIDSTGWNALYTSNFVKKLKNLEEEDVIKIFTLVSIFSQGFLTINAQKSIQMRELAKSAFSQIKYYSVPLQSNSCYYLLVSIGIEKVPIYNYNSIHIKQFQLQYFIEFHDIIIQQVFESNKIIDKILNQIQKTRQFDPKVNFKCSLQQLVDKSNIRDKTTYFSNQIHKQMNFNITKLYPIPYLPIQTSQIEIEDFQFMVKRLKFYLWKKRQAAEEIQEIQRIYEDGLTGFKRRQQDQISKLEEQMIKKDKFQLKNAAKIVQILEKVPNFKFPLTIQQRELLGKNENLIVVGRSGTGKTTCCMLRLYGIQLYLKKREIDFRIRNKHTKIEQNRCQMMMFDEIKQMKNVFLTASPFLIEQIKKQFDDLISQIKQSHGQKCQQCRKNNKNKTKQGIVDMDPLDRLKRQIQEQQQNLLSLNQLQLGDFPGFYTIKNFIKMIDRTIKYPFFSHQIRQNTVNREINHAFLNKYKNWECQKIKKNQFFVQESVEVDYIIFQEVIWQSFPKQFTRNSKENSLIPPAVVWSQIYSIIKGSLNAHSCPDGFISLKMYLQEGKNFFLSDNQKIRIYQMFKLYHKWCQKNQAFDLMDAVNYILQQIQLFAYKGPKMNYMFIDQVQDLTPATIYLVSKMVVNKIFYCGDTAQAITKGVNFRFEDIKFIFNKQYCNRAIQLDAPTDLNYLTVNFRSHNTILQLANSLVAGIQEIFPKAINKLNKQRSDLFGPKPFIINNNSTSLLFDLVCGLVEGKSLKIHQKFGKDRLQLQKLRQFSTEQIVIVRNLEQKDKLPEELQKGLVLTPQQAKGLEYDYVILFNFFGSCKCLEKWKILDYLQIQETYVDKKQFEEKLSRRSRQEKGIEEQMDDILKQLLGFDQKRNQYNVKNIKHKKSLNEVNINQYHEIVTQLKILYTVITRARSFLVIFDEKIPKSLLKIWQTMQLISTVNQDNMIKYREDIVKYEQREGHKKYLDEDLLWENQGFKMLTRKNYEQAKKCFRRINKQDICDRIDAMVMISKAQIELFRINKQLSNLEGLGREDKKLKMIKFYKEKRRILTIYASAGNIYRKYKRWIEAGDAYFEAQQYNQAINDFLKGAHKKKTCLCYMKLKQYQKAAQLFYQMQDYDKSLECYALNKDWTKIFKLFFLKKNKVNFSWNENRAILYRSIRQLVKQQMSSKIVKKQQEDYKILYPQQLQQTKQMSSVYLRGEISQQVDKIICGKNFREIQKNLKILEYKRQSAKFQNNQTIEAGKKILRNKQLLDKQLQLHLEIQSEIYKSFANQKMMRKQYMNKIQNSDQQLIDEIEDQYQNIFTLFKKEKNALKTKKQENQKRINLFETDATLLKKDFQKIKLKQEEMERENKQKIVDINRTVLCQQERLRQMINQMNVKIAQNKRQQRQVQRQKKPREKSFESKTTKVRNPHKIDEFQSSRIEQSIEYFEENYLKSNENSFLDFTIIEDDQGEVKNTYERNKNNVFGIFLFQKAKEQLLKKIKDIIETSERLINYEIQSSLDEYHHLFINRKLQRQFIDFDDNLRTPIKLLRQLDYLGNQEACLLICDYYSDHLGIFAIRYILGYCLQFSRNYNLKRYYKYSYESQNPNYLKNNLDQFLSYIKIQILQMKIPRLGFIESYYYESAGNNLVTGLILQGFYRQALQFCSTQLKCKICFLFSDQKNMYSSIINYANKLPTRQYKLPKKQYLFIPQELKIIMPRMDSVNIFTIQNIFYAYDQCQQHPIVSKKQKEQDIILLDEIEDYIYYYQVQDKIIELQQENIQNQHKIRLNDENIGMLHGWKEMLLSQNQCYKNQVRIEGQNIKKSIRQLEIKLDEKQKQIKQLQNQRKKLEIKRNYHKIKHKDKVKYEEKKKQLQVKPSQFSANQDLSIQRRIKQIEEERKQYENKLQLQEISQQQLDQIEGKIRLQVSQEKKIILSLRELKRNLRIHNQILENQNPSEYIKSMVSQYYQQYMKQKQILKQMIHEEVSHQKSKKSQEQKEANVYKYLVSLEKKRILKQKNDRSIKQMKKKIAQDSNLPEQNLFLNLFLKGSFRKHPHQKYIDKEQISIQFYKIFHIGANLNNNNKEDYKEQDICNVIIFYLSFLCDKNIRQTVQNQHKNLQIIYTKYHSKKIQIYKQIDQNERYLEYLNYKLGQINSANQRQKAKLQKQEKIFEEQKKRLNNISKKYNIYSVHPRELLQKFLETFHRRIKLLQNKNAKFMEILFGFFQCRVIKDCPPLQFLANEYVIVKSNSIVFEELKLRNENIFAYYLDNQNSTVLAKFMEVQKIVLKRLEQQYLNINSQLKIEQTGINSKNIKYFDEEIIGHKKKKGSDDETLLVLNICAMNSYQRESVKDQFYKYKQGLIFRQIREEKESLLKFLLANEFQSKESFYFVHHQLKQYYFIEQIYQRMDYYNHTLVKQMQKKKDGLKKNYAKWTSQLLKRK